MIDLQALADMAKQFAQEGTTFIYAAAMLTGLFFGILALKNIVDKGRTGGGYGQEKSWGAIAGRLVIASCFVTLASKLDSMIATTGNTEPLRQALAYAQGTSGAGSGPLAFVWAAISAWVVFVGTAGFMRGFLLFDKASQGQQDSGDAFWRGLWHIVGGAICVNVFS